MDVGDVFLENWCRGQKKKKEKKKVGNGKIAKTTSNYFILSLKLLLVVRTQTCRQFLIYSIFNFQVSDSNLVAIFKCKAHNNYILPSLFHLSFSDKHLDKIPIDSNFQENKQPYSS